MNDKTAQGLGSVAIVDAAECHQETAGVPMGPLDDKVGVIVYKKNTAVRKTFIGFIRASLDRDLTADAVRPTDSPDDDAHA